MATEPTTNPYAQFAQPNPYSAFGHEKPSRAQLSKAFRAAVAAGNTDAAKKIIGYVQQHGMTIAPPTADDVDAADQAGVQQTADAMPWYQKMLAGAGKSAADTARGAMQLVGANPASVGLGVAPQADNALMHTGGGFVGDMAGQLGQMYAGGVLLKPLVGAARIAPKAIPYVNSALTSGVFSALQPAGSIGQRLENAGIGAALGAAGEAAPRVLGALGRKAAPVYSDATAAAPATARHYGIPLHLTQVANSRFVKALGSAARSLPVSGTVGKDEAQRLAWNKALASTMGEDADELTPALVKHAKTVAGNEYDHVLSAHDIDMDAPTMDALANAQAAAHAELTDAHATLVDKQIDSILDEAANNDGVVSGKKYQDLRNSLKDSSSANPTLKHHLGAVRAALEDAADRQIPELRPLNQRYRNIKTIERGLKQVGGANNTITPANLYHLTQGKFGATPEMHALAQLGQTVLKDPIANTSNTAIHSLIYHQLYNPLAWTPIATMGVVGTTAGRLMNSAGAARGIPMLGSELLRGVSALARPANRALPLLTPAITQ